MVDKIEEIIAGFEKTEDFLSLSCKKFRKEKLIFLRKQLEK